MLIVYALSCSPIKGGFDAKELFHVYITRWIQEKRLALLEFCKFDKVFDYFSNFYYVSCIFAAFILMHCTFGTLIS